MSYIGAAQQTSGEQPYFLAPGFLFGDIIDVDFDNKVFKVRFRILSSQNEDGNSDGITTYEVNETHMVGEVSFQNLTNAGVFLQSRLGVDETVSVPEFTWTPPVS
ncbi:hypothetical protein SEA_LIMPID_118 [Streptomyces phage Limpid]|uniref:Uncharacterized protein n=1 Tax=Streptomyces phage Limpid TaxID=2653770 RepID=A0A5Q2WPD9_9CAUD|nr:hypothetical protein SEA_LIMPID_118 [Streptomyces phage Limpid]